MNVLKELAQKVGVEIQEGKRGRVIISGDGFKLSLSEKNAIKLLLFISIKQGGIRNG